MAIGRPIEFDPDVALDAAMQLFWRKGYVACSLQDLLTTMGLSKSSFYQTFDSKHALFQRCIQRYRQSLTGELRSQLGKAESARGFLSNLFYGVANETRGENARRGCLLMNTASEFAQSDRQIAALVNSSLENFAEVFEAAIRQAQQQGEVAASKDARVLAKYLVSSMSGLKNMVKAGADRKTVRDVAEVVLSTLN